MNLPRTLRIAYVDYVLEPDKPGRSGLSDIVWDMATELVNQGHEAHVIASYTTNNYPDPRVIVHNFPMPPIGYRNIIGQLWILKRAADVVKRNQFDIIHAPEYVSTAVFATLGVKTPLVFSSPGNIFERVSNINHFDWTATTVYKWAAVKSAKQCSNIIATSREMKYWWVYSGAKEENVKILPLGVDTSLFHKINNAKKTLGLDDSQNILFVGRLQRENNLEQLIRALKIVSSKIPSIKLDVVGDGEQEKYLHNLSKQLQLFENIRWHKKVQLTVLPLYYSAATIFVLPRLSRVTPRVVIESMACGTPVVASNIGGINDIITNQVTGILVNPYDSVSLSEAILTLLEDTRLYGNLVKNASEYVKSELSLGIITNKIIKQVYYQII